VLPDTRRRGIGTALLEFTVDRLAERGVDRVFALALARNDVATEFYEATGFDRVRTGTTTIAGEEYEELVFERPI
jgi:ribosomal protein S18 acetylase RimI-like enzyme